MKLSIIIVNYNTLELLQKCVASIEKFCAQIEYELIVVDNASTDGSAQHVKTLAGGIVNSHNCGFSAANNIGIVASRGEYVLLLNPDTELLDEGIAQCVSRMELEKDVGILGCQLVLDNGDLDLACKRGFPNLWNSFCKFSGLSAKFPHKKVFCGYNLTYLDRNQNHDVDCVVGAFMLVPRRVFDKIGLLDESFFMYGEDIDLCFRAKEAGFHVCYFGCVKVLHHKRASSVKSAKARVEFFKAMQIYYDKHFLKRHNLVTRAMVAAGIKLLARFRT